MYGSKLKAFVQFSIMYSFIYFDLFHFLWLVCLLDILVIIPLGCAADLHSTLSALPHSLPS